MSDVGLIIPVRDHWDYVIRTIDTAVRHTPGAHILVLDDASTEWRDDVPRRLASLVPPGRLLVHRFREHGGLTRSWNAGLLHCRELGCEYAVPANSDLAFAPGWWSSLERALDAATFVGPLSNAPGHQREQDVRNFLTRYETDDSDDAIAACASLLATTFADRCAAPRKGRLNGFVVAGRTKDFWSLALTDTAVYDPAIPFDGNEDDFHRRAFDEGDTLTIALSSFVFHYKGVSRDTTHLVRPHKQHLRPGHRVDRPITGLSELSLGEYDPVFIEE